MSSWYRHRPVSYEADDTLAQSSEQAGTGRWSGTAGRVSAGALHTCPRADACSPKPFILIKTVLCGMASSIYLVIIF